MSWFPILYFHRKPNMCECHLGFSHCFCIMFCFSTKKYTVRQGNPQQELLEIRDRVLSLLLSWFFLRQSHMHLKGKRMAGTAFLVKPNISLLIIHLHYIHYVYLCVSIFLVCIYCIIYHIYKRFDYPLMHPHTLTYSKQNHAGPDE